MADDRFITLHDEALRDGGQSYVVQSAVSKANHMIAMFDNGWSDVVMGGWLSSPVDVAALEYISEHCPDLKPRILMYTNLHLDDEVDPQNPKHTFFDKFRTSDLYGIASIITKGMPEDALGLGLENADDVHAKLAGTIRLLREVAPERPVQIIIEHAFSSCVEGHRDFIQKTITAALLSGVEKIALPDTDGAMTPGQIKNVIEELTVHLQNSEELIRAGINFKPSQFTIHTHNNYALALANIAAALEVGVGGIDASTNGYGEGFGNADMLEVAALVMATPGITNTVAHPLIVNAYGAYCDQLHEEVGTRAGERSVTNPASYEITSGTHASALLKALKAQPGKTVEEVLEGYNGSYNRAPFQTFIPASDRLVTLSPVSGVSNVQWLLETLGVEYDPKDKGDMRKMRDILEVVKTGELERGLSYRGGNNANAITLIADKFGLRKQLDKSGNEATNNLSVSSLGTGHTTLSLGGKDVVRLKLNPSDNVSDLELASMAHQLTSAFIWQSASLVPEMSSIAVGQIRMTTIEAGKPKRKYPESNTDFTAEGVPVKSVRIEFSDGQHKWQAFGVGETPLKALSMAVEKGMDYKLFLVEQERVREAKPALVDVSNLTRWTTEQAIQR